MPVLLKRPTFFPWNRPNPDHPNPPIVDLIEIGATCWEVVCRSCRSRPSIGAATFGLEHAKALARSHLIANGIGIPKELWSDE